MAYVCRDEEGLSPIKNLKVFDVVATPSFQITSSPTELGVARQDNKVRNPRKISVTATAKITQNGVGATTAPDADGWQEYFCKDRDKIFSVVDASEKVYKGLSVESFKCSHSTQTPDLYDIQIEFLEILDAGEIFDSNSADSEA